MRAATLGGGANHVVLGKRDQGGTVMAGERLVGLSPRHDDLARNSVDVVPFHVRDGRFRTRTMGRDRRRGQSTMATWKRAPLVLSLLFLPACSGGVAHNSLTATSPRPGANDHLPASSANATLASPPANDASFTCATQTSGGTPGLLAQLTDVRTATHPGYDRITFQFARPAAPPSSSLAAAEVPSFALTSQASANFARGDGL